MARLTRRMMPKISDNRAQTAHRCRQQYPASTVSMSPVMAASGPEIGGADGDLIHIRRPARQRDAPLLQAIESIGTSQSPGDVLFDNDHAGAVLANAGNHLIDIFNDDSARPRLISSHSRIEGFDINARPMAIICCCPPESTVTLLFRRSLRTGNIR